MARITFASLLVVSGLVGSGCGAGPTNGGGAPNLDNTNRIGLPGGEINTRGGFSNKINGGGSPSFDKTNPRGLPGGPINYGGGLSDSNAKQPPPAPAPVPAAADGGSIDL